MLWGDGSHCEDHAAVWFIDRGVYGEEKTWWMGIGRTLGSERGRGSKEYLEVNGSEPDRMRRGRKRAVYE